MDYLPTEPFYFDPKTPIAELIRFWEEQDLWFFKIEKHEEPYFTIKQADLTFVLDNGKTQRFTSQELAEQYVVSKQLLNTEVIPEVYTYYTAQNVNGRYIGGTFVPIKKFATEDKAQRAAFDYNSDCVKMQQSAARFITKQ